MSTPILLVTGAAGFIGHWLALRLAETGARVRGIDSGHGGGGFNPFHREKLADRVDWIEGDLLDPAVCTRAVKNVSTVYHLAGNGSHADSMLAPLTDLDANLRATELLMEAIRAAGTRPRVVFASTRQLYGRADKLPVSEDAPLRMVDVNAIHKMAAEELLRLYDRVHGIPSVILRLSNVFGPGLRIADSRQGFYGGWIRALLENRPFEVWGGSQVRDFVWVHDAVEAFRLAGEWPSAASHTYNIAGGVGTRLDHLAAALVRRHGGGSYQIQAMPETQQRIEVGDFVADISKAARDLTWRPNTSIEAMIAKTLNYYQQHRGRYLGS
jgi:UDP-glucose 4-epimerase